MASWVLSPLAREELEEILDYIAVESGSAVVADRVAVDFAEALNKLADLPRMGWQRHDLTGSDVRWWQVHSYLIVYDAESEPVRVLRILHAARELGRVFE